MKYKGIVGLLPVKTLVRHKVQRYNSLCFHFLSISYKMKILQFRELQDSSFLFIELLWSCFFMVKMMIIGELVERNTGFGRKLFFTR